MLSRYENSIQGALEKEEIQLKETIKTISH